MSEHMSIVAAIFMVFVSVASGGALFVSMKVSSSIGTFREQLVKELDARYVMKTEHTEVALLQEQLDNTRRAVAKEKLEGVEIELHRYRDDLDITLKGILSAIQETHTKTKQRM